MVLPALFGITFTSFVQDAALAAIGHTAKTQLSSRPLRESRRSGENFDRCKGKFSNLIRLGAGAGYSSHHECPFPSRNLLNHKGGHREFRPCACRFRRLLPRASNKVRLLSLKYV